MTKRYIFKKWNDSQDLTRCWECGEPTLFFILDKRNGEEFFCCLNCAKKYKIKNVDKYSSFLKKAILEEISKGKIEDICREGGFSE